MKTLSAVLVAVCAFAAPLLAADGDIWITDFAKAKEQAAAKSVPILVDFTGSDWCGWCIKLDKEVFSQAEFQEYAKDSLILVKIDFPRKKLPEAEASANKALEKQFNIEGYPTIVLVDATGKELARTGYRPGGPAAYVTHLKDLLKK